MKKRACIIVLDSLGVGALPDAADYTDAGADTLGHIQDRHPLSIPNLQKLGMGNITGAAGGRLRIDAPVGAFGRFMEGSAGKDTITGHWEIAGIETDVPFLTFPDGFPQELMDAFVRETGRGYLGNVVASGTEIIQELGPQHERTGKVIVYTSADSVFQIAANVDVVPLEELYRICEIARSLLVGPYAVGRVIARPYILEADGTRTRTADRRDFAVHPPEKTLLDLLKEDGQMVHAIGKISDIFNGSGVTSAVHTESNDDGISKTIEALQGDAGAAMGSGVDRDAGSEADGAGTVSLGAAAGGTDGPGLIFTNLVDFDSKYGHRRDPEGYAQAIEAFDARLPEILDAMREDDLLILCSDHGNDPIHHGFNHTREYIFGLFAGSKVRPGTDLGTRASFGDIGQTVIDYLTDGRLQTRVGKSMRSELGLRIV